MVYSSAFEKTVSLRRDNEILEESTSRDMESKTRPINPAFQAVFSREYAEEEKSDQLWIMTENAARSSDALMAIERSKLPV